MRELKINSSIVAVLVGALSLIAVIPAIQNVLSREEPIEEYHIILTKLYGDDIDELQLSFDNFNYYVKFYQSFDNWDIFNNTVLVGDLNISIDYIDRPDVYLKITNSIDEVLIINQEWNEYLFTDFNEYGIYDFSTIEYDLLSPDYQPIFTPH